MSRRLPPGGRPERRPAPIDDPAAVELMALATVAVAHDLCSRLFPDVIENIQRDTGHEPGAAAREMAAMFKTARSRGNHYTPEQVAKILRGRAAQIQRGERMRKYR